MNKLKILAIIFCGLLGLSNINAIDYITVSKAGNVYDDANAKYITVNQNNEDVNVIPGMVFATSQHTPGWYKVEYSPGIHAFIPEQIASTNTKPLSGGTYEIQNQPGHSLTIQGSGDNWNATADGKAYKGLKWENILIFQDENNNIAYTVVDIGNGPIAINYDNSVTKFF